MSMYVTMRFNKVTHRSRQGVSFLLKIEGGGVIRRGGVEVRGSEIFCLQGRDSPFVPLGLFLQVPPSKFPAKTHL